MHRSGFWNDLLFFQTMTLIQSLIQLSKALWIPITALLYGLACFLNGSAKIKNKQLENDLKNAQETQKFKQDLDATPIADKRKFLRDKYPKKGQS